MLRNSEDIFCGFFDSSFLRCKNSTRTEKRTVTCLELELFFEDGGKSYIDGVGYERRRGMVIIARPGQVRYSETPVRCYYIKLLAPDEDDLAFINTIPTVFYLDNTTYEKAYDLYSRMVDIHVDHADAPFSILKLNSIFYNLLYCYTKGAIGEDSQASTDSTPTNLTLISIKNYIDSNPGIPCSLKEMGELFHISPNYMQKLFKQHFGKSPHEYRESVLIRRARRMIADGRYNLLEISMELGFSSQSHFNRVFKAHMGMTPAVYRRKVLEEY